MHRNSDFNKGVVETSTMDSDILFSCYCVPFLDAARLRHSDIRETSLCVSLHEKIWWGYDVTLMSNSWLCTHTEYDNAPE